MNAVLNYCIVDSFAGGGGASTGIEMATGHPVDIAINHSEAAIMMHKRNHPFTEHYIEDVWKVNPVSATRGRVVPLAWFSPDCKHFSRAKGAALCDKKIRGLAWVILRWAHDVRPYVIMIENVPEFVTWGPLRRGNPIKSKSGQTFNKFIKQLQNLGYTVDWQLRCAADDGAPTIRTRLHIIARCDGRPIVWPERTYAPRDSKEVKSGNCLPWRSAAEIIDFDLPCPSIFASKREIKAQYGLNVQRPLKSNTLQRIARGLDKFVIKSLEPFIIPRGYGEKQGQAPRVHDVKEPLPTVVGINKHYLCKPLFSPYFAQGEFSVPYIMSNNSGNVAHSIVSPIPTVTTGYRNYLVLPSLIQYHSERLKNEVRGQSLFEPLNTVDTSNRYGLSFAYLSKYYSGDNFQLLASPLHTVTTRDRESLIVVHLAHFKGKDKGQSLFNPLMTVTACDGQFAEIRTILVKYEACRDLKHWNDVRSLLNTYCGYEIKDNEILLFLIQGVLYFISDLGLRMLTPRELYDAMGFPHDYIIDRDSFGKKIPKSEQVARCGNAVCPPVAEALVRANLPELCTVKYRNMRELYNYMIS